jgi:predicted AlkP superfamily pyrophosphatase or phosphodiesterase
MRVARLRSSTIGFGVLVSLVVLASSTPLHARPTDRIALVVSVTVDQLGALTMSRWASLSKGGFQRLRSRGAYFTEGVFEYAATETSAGHGTIATGAWPNVHGLVSNYWFDSETGQRIGCIEDPEFHRSPKNLNVPTLADALRLATGGRAKTVSVSIKDRAGIIVAGWRPTAAVFYDEKEGRFREADWYRAKEERKEASWIAEVDREMGPRAVFGKRWDRLRPDLDYEKLAGPDDDPHEADIKGLGRTFPRTLGQGLEGPTPPYLSTFGGTPAALDALFSLARHAARAEKLGKRGGVDLLSVGVSTLDYAGHWWGPESQEALDVFLRIDKAIGDLIDDLEREVGPGSILWVVTADHGVAPTPERSKAIGLRAERVDEKRIMQAVNDALSKLSPKAPVTVEDLNMPRLYLKLGEHRQKERLLYARAAAEKLRTLPEVLDARAYADLDQLNAPYATAMKRSTHPGREPDVMILGRPLDLILPFPPDGVGTGSDHSSPYLYDQAVPILIMGPGVRRGEDRTPYAMTRLAPTIAALLAIAPPTAAYDPPLPIIEHLIE